MSEIRNAIKKPREYVEPVVDMTMPMAQVFQNKIIELDNKVTDRIVSLEKTILDLALHIQKANDLEVKESPWTPEHSKMLLWKNEEEGISWQNHYKGGKIFLVCGGPSLNDLDLSLMDNRGVMSMCMNNSWIKVKPDFWMGFDAPGRFHDGGWEDPSIMKLVPWQRRHKPLSHRVNGKLEESGKTPLDAPNCWMVSNNTEFNEDTWFTEQHVNWGGPIKGVEPEKGYRVTILGALRILYYLGFQEVYLLGCDWGMPLDMSKDAYSWDEERPEKVRKVNNKMYAWI